MKPVSAGAPRRRVWPWFVIAGGFGVWLALHDATWLRPLLQHHLLALSQRHVDFDDLRLGLSG